VFDLTAGRNQTFPQAFVSGYRGFVHADAYDGYNAVHGNVRHLGCWMHARRYFVEAASPRRTSSTPILPVSLSGRRFSLRDLDSTTTCASSAKEGRDE
jgi:hypothetical protein